MASKTSEHYKKNPESRAKRLAYQREYNKSSEAKKHRAECNAGRKKLGLKKGDKRDASHTKSGGMVAEPRSANRKRNGSGNRPRLK